MFLALAAWCFILTFCALPLKLWGYFSILGCISPRFTDLISCVTYVLCQVRAKMLKKKGPRTAELPYNAIMLLNVPSNTVLYSSVALHPSFCHYLQHFGIWPYRELLQMSSIAPLSFFVNGLFAISIFSNWITSFTLEPIFLCEPSLLLKIFSSRIIFKYFDMWFFLYLHLKPSNVHFSSSYFL